VELYSQLAGNAFPPHWEYVPNKQGTRSQLSGNIGRKRNCQSRGKDLREPERVITLRGQGVKADTSVNTYEEYRLLLL
ncbi:hypothetical protein, partial [uncultured Bacteroides sp.]|uniref:hypothetical protein n=1 Tax=uncultured Bacteroides sp. TaxID=162156 RepID=UPI00261BCB21